MKKNYALALVVFWTGITISYAQYTSIPDAQFEAGLSLYDDIPNDGQVPTANIETITRLDVADEGISDLTGIEDFIALKELDAYENEFTTIDLSNNLALESLDLSNVPLTEINLKGLTTLAELTLVSNNLTAIDVSTNTGLTSLISTGNNIISYNLKNNSLLSTLAIVSSTTTAINIKNGNNENIINPTIYGAATLCVAVDDEAYSETNWTNVQSVAVFTEGFCNYTLIPDTNFEARLNSLGHDDIANDGQVPTANIEGITFLNIANRNISDLTGIKAFKALETLSAADNKIVSIDLTTNVNLSDLNLGRNNLVGIDISKNTLLITIELNDNNISSIDLSANTIVEELVLRGNELTVLDLSNNTALVDLSISENAFTSIDVSNNTKLETIDAEACGLESIVLTGLTLLEDLDLEENNIVAIDVSDNIGLIDIDISDNNTLVTIDLTNNVALETMSFSSCTNLESVFFGSSPNLNQVSLSNTALTTIDISLLTGLQTLSIANSSMEFLDVSKNVILKNLYAENTKLRGINLRNGANTLITTLDIATNTDLYCVAVDDIDYANNTFTDKDAQTNFSIDCETLVMDLSVILEGAFQSGDASLLMRDDLNDNDILPTTSPYIDAALFEGFTFNGPGGRSIVDWVEIQLRNPNDISEILYKQSALLQQSGQVVGFNGNKSSLEVTLWQGNYYIAIAHRNHLTIVSSTPHLLNDEDLELDLTNVSNILNGTNATTNMGDGYYAMPAGDIDGNGQIQNSDINEIIQLLGSSGYSDTDLDMNGQVQNIDINNIINTNVGKGQQF
ncbi:hypothetical protein OAT18_01225 [Tenacibaculum sp.]|nr:hypothetical protein [Tenacibaculum sp.]